MAPHMLATMLVLFGAVILFTTVARRWHLPYPSLLALGGLVMALLPGLPHVDLEPSMVLFVFLPPLLFVGGWRTPWSDFARLLGPISVLAIGLVLFTTFGVGLVAHHVDPALPLSAALVLGAVVSPTDPLAASAVARQVQLPQRILSLLEGESLANDATGLVVYHIAVAAALTGQFSIAGGVADFVLLATGGIAMGLFVGFVSVALQRWVDDPPLQFALQVITAYASYLPAERVGFSGVFAAVTAGLVCGRFGSYALGANSRLQAVAVWDTIDLLLNAALFLLLGLQVRVVLVDASRGELVPLLRCAAIISLATIVLRVVWVFAGAYLARLRSRRHGPPAPLNVLGLVAWSGMRGVLSLATALAVPKLLASGEAFPGRSRILSYAFCVIVVTLIVQGLPLPAVIRWLRIPRDEPRHEGERLARIALAKAARNLLDTWDAEGDELMSGLVVDLRARYAKELELLDPSDSPPESLRVARALADLRGHIVRAQRDALLRLHARGQIDDHVHRSIERELDLQQARLS